MRWRWLTTIVLATALASPSAATVAQEPATAAGVLDESAPPGENYDRADFRFWMPPGVTTARAFQVATMFWTGTTMEAAFADDGSMHTDTVIVPPLPV